MDKVTQINSCRGVLLTLVLSILTAAPVNITVSASEPANTNEQLFRNSVHSLLENNTEKSVQQLELLFEKQPEFRIAHAIYADLLAAYAHQDTLLSSPEIANKTRVTGIKEEIAARASYQPPNAEHLPENIMRISNTNNYVLLLDAAHSRLYVFQNANSKPKLIADYYATIGKGGMGKLQENDNKTPLGVYYINSYLDDQELPALYGAGAYPLNYPNAWDKLSKRNGYGIWLHGMPSAIYSRPPEDSRGCIIVSNHLFTTLENYIEPGHTPIILTQNVRWLSPQKWEKNRQQLTAMIHQWKSDWESLNTDKYLSHYSKNYLVETGDYPIMEKQFQQNMKHKEYIQVTLKNMELFYYNDSSFDETKTATVVFDQDYQSNNYNTSYRKRQLWQIKDDSGKIFYSGKDTYW